MTRAKPFHHEEQARYRASMEHLFGGENHPEANTFRSWIDMRAALGEGLFAKARRWAAEVPYEERPGTYVLSNSLPGGIWCNSEPAVVAIGRTLEPEVSRLLGRRAWISYAGLSVYFRGVPLVRHRDIGSGSKYLVSWPVLLDIEGGWPLHVERPDGDRTAVDIFDNSSADRALMFAGHDVFHWRDPYPSDVGLLMYLRFTAFDLARTHTEAEIDRLADAGVAELDGRPAEAPLDLIEARCTSQDLALANRPYLTVPGLFTAEECAMLRFVGGGGAWLQWVARRLRRAVSEGRARADFGVRFRRRRDPPGGPDMAAGAKRAGRGLVPRSRRAGLRAAQPGRHRCQPRLRPSGVRRRQRGGLGGRRRGALARRHPLPLAASGRRPQGALRRARGVGRQEAAADVGLQSGTLVDMLARMNGRAQFGSAQSPGP